MHFRTALLSCLFLASQCLQSSSATNSHNRHLLGRRTFDIEDQLRRHARGIMDHRIGRRQSMVNFPASGDASKIDLAKWEADTELACESALLKLNGQASNPTGMAVCYNLPFLDNATGVFEAEVRIYNISAPVDPWVGVRLSDISMTLSYLGATVQTMSSPFAKRDSTLSWPPIKAREVVALAERQDAPASSTVPAPTQTGVGVPKPSNELRVLYYVGKLNSNVMSNALANNEQLQRLLIPTIELDATNPVTSQQVKVVLSSPEASYVNGVFAMEAMTPTDSAAAAASASNLAATAAPFKVPGISLGVSPIGLIVTLAWTVLFCVAIGFGTVGRIQFRDQYRRRVKMDQARSISTF